MTRTIEEVMTFLQNYTMAWHHWLILLSLLKTGGSATKKQIFPVFKKEGFSSHAIEGIFKRDLEDLGEAVEVQGGIDEISDSSMIYLTNDKKFRTYLKKNLKTVVRMLKQRKAK